MNNFHESGSNLYDSKFIEPLIKNPAIKKIPSNTFYKEDTAPLPVIPKVTSYPSEWDEPRGRKLPSLNKILSNHHYVLACVIFTSIIVVIALVKAVILFATK